MNTSVDELAGKLEAVLGAGAVTIDEQVLRAHAVDGMRPTARCTPADAGQVAEVMRICASTGAAITPWGGGTAMRLGNLPHRVDVVLGLERINGLVEHDDANLTATVQAGMTCVELQRILGRRKQFLAVDPPHPHRATVGGVVAANSNGPRRMMYGGVRDLVIGMKMVLATGEQVKAGGKVVKNVAGYDMCKLFVGSLGTLGIMTEVTFKMAPLPEVAATMVARGPLAAGMQLIDELFQSTLQPAAIATLCGETARRMGLPGGSPAVAVWVEGFQESVQRHLTDIRTMAGRLGLAADVLDTSAHPRLWDAVRDFAADESLVYRVTVPLGSVADVVGAVDRWSADGRPARYLAHAGTGAVWVALDDEPSGVEWFSRLTALAGERGGHAVITAAGPAVKQHLDVWGPPPPALAIMREIKREFDPQGLLNPGRFVAFL